MLNVVPVKGSFTIVKADYCYEIITMDQQYITSFLKDGVLPVNTELVNQGVDRK